MNKSPKYNIDELVTKVLVENENDLNELITLFQDKIDNKELPKAASIVKDQDSEKKIKRPPNSNILYTNQLGKCGLLQIIRNFCNKYKINKQSLVPISKKVSKHLWKKLSPVHQQFFDELASEVVEEHKKLHPNYKYKPERRKRKTTTYKHYDPKKTSKPVPSTDSSPVHHVSTDDELYEESSSSSSSSTSTSTSTSTSNDLYEDPPTFNAIYDFSKYYDFLNSTLDFPNNSNINLDLRDYLNHIYE
jgi:hypothetical protein